MQDISDESDDIAAPCIPPKKQPPTSLSPPPSSTASSAQKRGSRQKKAQRANADKSKGRTKKTVAASSNVRSRGRPKRPTTRPRKKEAKGLQFADDLALSQDHVQPPDQMSSSSEDDTRHHVLRSRKTPSKRIKTSTEDDPEAANYSNQHTTSHEEAPTSTNISSIPLSFNHEPSHGHEGCPSTGHQLIDMLFGDEEVSRSPERPSARVVEGDRDGRGDRDGHELAQVVSGDSVQVKNTLSSDTMLSSRGSEEDHTTTKKENSQSVDIDQELFGF